MPLLHAQLGEERSMCRCDQSSTCCWEDGNNVLATLFVSSPSFLTSPTIHVFETLINLVLTSVRR